MKCPGCSADVVPEQDFCMDCGEPIAGMKPVVTRPTAAPAPITRPAPVAAPAPAARPAPIAAAVPAGRAATPADVQQALRRTLPAKTSAIKKKREEEPETIRCPGCGSPSRAVRCPGCGIRLRSED